MDGGYIGAATGNEGLKEFFALGVVLLHPTTFLPNSAGGIQIFFSIVFTNFHVEHGSIKMASSPHGHS